MSIDELDIGVTKAAPSLLADIKRLLGELENLGVDESSVKLSEKLRASLDPFQEAPQLLDPLLENVVSRLADAILDIITADDSRTVNEWPFEILYTLCKVRGYKTVCQFLPPQVTLLEDVVSALDEDEPMGNGAKNEQDVVKQQDQSQISGIEESGPAKFRPVTWQQRYSLLLWLSILVLAPFDLDTFGPEIQTKLYTVAKKYISVPGKERDAAILVMSRLVTRSDTIDVLLPLLFGDISEIFDLRPSNDENNGNSSITTDYVSNAAFFGRLGALQTTAMVFQLVPHNKHISDQLSSLYDTFLQKILLNETEAKGAMGASTFDKLKVKNLGRIAILLLSQVESGKAGTREDHYFDYIEEIIGELLKFLSNKDTLVRYSTSKAISRIVQRLPSEDFKLDVIDAVLSTMDNGSDNMVPSVSFRSLSAFFDQKSPSSWHGALLCIAEMLRRNLLVPRLHFTRLTKILNLSLRFEQQKLTYSLGDNVRDASCYACWSLFRVYQNIDNSVIDALFRDLVNLACYDPEVNIRRAASAALQEGVGRQGGCNGSVEKQVGLVQTIEYFKIGLRSRSYLEVVLQIYDLGFSSVVDYALERTVCNWDPAIRRLSAVSLRLLAENSMYSDRNGVDSGHNIVSDTIIKALLEMYDDRDIDIRHGVVYTLGEVLGSEKHLSDINSVVDSNQITNILHGFSESDLRQDNEVLNSDAFLHLAKCFVQHNVKGYDEQDMINKLTICMELNDKNVANGVSEIMKCFQNTNHTVNAITPAVLDKWIQRMMAGKSTFALALGLVSNLPTGELQKVLDALVSVIKGNSNVVVKDLSTRAQAVHSLGELFIALDSEDRLDFLVDNYFDALVFALNDYTVDSRGDVGSWVRGAAIQESTKLYSSQRATEAFRNAVVRRLLGMSVEILLKLRVCAVEHLKQLPLSMPQLKHIVDTISGEYERSAKVLYSHMTQIFALELDPASSTEFMISYISAAGAQHVSEDTLRGSLGALVNYLRKLSPEGIQLFLTQLSDIIDVKRYGSQTVICALRVLAHILNSGLLLSLYAKDNKQEVIKRLYIRTFNAHINTKQLPRISAAIEVFSGLARLGHHESTRRLAVLCNHIFPLVRVGAAESLREVLVTLLEDDTGELDEDSIAESIDILEEAEW
ncbi:hypothetical protein AWJ20_1497 [Sugiyamaella lignohabitans]|uniref:Tubulin-folding cofactor D ARM repeats domain-containing protein n=1 Tax=Sugiyamaella lignohabitans TaxID=796027 RepID=A0A167DRT5_9ASCO|nr:uncharacterized protein AWJ20_1497 [Sugiyamaella lignohabitans]ANB13215.1 hypothetical protein AWJ20_1497 [Sugiyamaella lignohabitans]